MVDNLDIVAHFLKSLSEGKTLEQGSIVIPVVECENADFHKKLKKEAMDQRNHKKQKKR